MTALVILPRQLVVDGSGDPRSGARLYIYDAGTTTARTSYTTAALSTTNAHPVVAVSTGLFPAIYVDPLGGNYKLVLKDSADVTIWTEDNIQVINYGSSDVRFYGLVANSTGARAANTAALKTLLDPDVAGIVGTIIFPNLTGTDTYYFGVDDIPIRDGVVLDLQGCTIDFAGTYDAAMDLHGFLECIRDVTIKNGTINVNYDGSAGTNNGMAIRVGIRAAYPFGSITESEEQDFASLMGSCVQKNLRITSNNPSGAAILMLGGLDGNICEDVYINGTALVPIGIYYEFGFWQYTSGGGAANKSSHATNLHFTNIHIENMKATTPSEGLSLVGCMSAIIDGIVIDGGYNGIVHRCGEALYYNKGTPWVDMLAHIDMRNVVITDTASTAFSCVGAESKSGGYLSGEAGVTEAKQCDLISFALDGFSIEGTMVFSGRSASIKNGVQRSGSTSGGILLQDELMWFDIDNVRVLDSAGIGIRSQTGTNIFAVARFKSGSIRNSFVAGSADEGIALSNCKGVVIDSCRFGYETVHDGVSETTQNAGVSNGSTSIGLTVRNCYGGGISSGSMYTNAGSGGWKYCKLESPQGDKTLSGQWTIDGHGMDADIGDASTTLDPGVDLPEQRMATALTTANKTITLGTGYQGAYFRLTKTTATGAFTVDFGGLKTIPVSTAAAVEAIHDGTAWRLASYSLL